MPPMSRLAADRAAAKARREAAAGGASWDRIESQRAAGLSPSSDPLVRPGASVPQPKTEEKKNEPWASSGRSFGDVKRPFSSPKAIDAPQTAMTAKTAQPPTQMAMQNSFESAKEKATPEQAAAMEVMARSAEDLKSMHEITKGLRKRILKVGDTSEEGRGRPTPGSTVTIQYVATLYPDGGEPFASTRKLVAPPGQSLTEREINKSTAPGPYTFTLGKGTVVAAWEIGVQTMKIGEVCECIAAPPLAYGEAGAPHLGVPSNYPIRFEMELLEWKEAHKERRGMTSEVRIEEATMLKNRGTDKFKASKWQGAIELYDMATYYIADGFFGADYLQDAAPEETIPKEPPSRDNPPPPPLFPEGTAVRETAQALVISALLNAAQCAIKLEDWRIVEGKTSKVLQLDKKNVKALFRRGIARTNLGDWYDAKEDLKKANSLDPKSKEIRQAFEDCKAAEAAEKEATKKLYAGTGATDGRGYEAPPEEEPDPLFVY